MAPPAKLGFSIEVIGSDLYGQQFFETAQTLTVYSNGVSILLANKLAADCEVIVRNPETNVETIAAVIGQLRTDAAGQVYGLAFQNPVRELWRAPIADPERAKTVALECGACHSLSEVSLLGIELEMFEAVRELTRRCEKCKSSRAWRQATREASEPGLKPVATPHAAPDSAPAAAAKEERRKARRMTMKASASIRYAGLETIVTCEDVSKGGFRFVSGKEFPEGTRVESAVPYTKFGNNIFLPACVVYCRKLPDGQFRHGVAYIKTSGSIGWDSPDIVR